MLPLMHSIKDAQERYYLANGQYAVAFEDLDVDLPASCTRYLSYNNMFYCDDWYVDNSKGGGVPYGDLVVLFCPNTPEKNTDYLACVNNTEATLHFLYDHALYATDEQRGKITCTPKTSLGTKLCNTLRF